VPPIVLSCFCSAAIIASLLLLARRNRKEGWRRKAPETVGLLALREALRQERWDRPALPIAPAAQRTPDTDQGLQLLKLNHALERETRRPTVAPEPAPSADRPSATLKKRHLA
jgi:hypothetical protein